MVIGSGIASQRLSPTDVGLQLLENALATGAGLAVLILALGPVAVANWLDIMAGIAEFAAQRGYSTNQQTAAAFDVARALTEQDRP